LWWWRLERNNEAKWQYIFYVKTWWLKSSFASRVMFLTCCGLNLWEIFLILVIFKHIKNKQALNVIKKRADLIPDTVITCCCSSTFLFIFRNLQKCTKFWIIWGFHNIHHQHYEERRSFNLKIIFPTSNLK
jgi:hypothetical protein